MRPPTQDRLDLDEGLVDFIADEYLALYSRRS